VSSLLRSREQFEELFDRHRNDPRHTISAEGDGVGFLALVEYPRIERREARRPSLDLDSPVVRRNDVVRELTAESA
jgi:hypothetical protein